MRRVQRIAAVVAGVVVLLLAAAVVVPALIDWRPYVQELAADVRAATGHDLVLAGDLDVRLLPRPRVTATELSLERPDGGAPLLTVERLRLEARLWPLLRGALAVEDLTIEAPRLDLAIDAAGRPNWRADASVAEAADVALPDLSVAAARVVGGRVRFADARNDVQVTVDAVALSASLADVAAPLELAGALQLDGQPLTLDATLATPAALLAGDAAKLATRWRGPLFDLAFDGRVGPSTLGGAITAAAPSLGELAAWLGEPLPADPGGVTLSAQADIAPATGAVTALAVALPDADVRTVGSVRWADGLPSVDLAVTTGVLDLEPYLPESEGTGADDWAWFDAPLDLTPASGFNAVVRLDSAGARMGDATFGRIDAVVTARDGAFAARLTEVGVRGGTGRGSFSLSVADEGVRGHVALTLERVALAELVARLTGGATAAQGTLDAEFDVAAAGATPRDLLADLSGRVGVNLGGDADADADALSRLRLGARFSGAAAGPQASASAVYRGEAVEARLAMGTLSDVLAGARFPLKLDVSSRLGQFAYEGDVLQRPVPSLDGVLSADVPALGDLWGWLGSPLGIEPGPARVRLELFSDGTTGTIEDAEVILGALALSATGDFDASGDVPTYRAEVRTNVLNLDNFVAAFAGDTEDENVDGGELDVAIDLAPLRDQNVDLGVVLAGVRLAEVTTGEVRLAASLADGRLSAALDPVDWGGARFDARLEVDATTDEATARLRGGLEAPSAGAVPPALELDDRLSGAIVAAFDVATAGGSVAGLLNGLDGSAEIQFDSFSLAEEELGLLDEVAVTVAFQPGDVDGSIGATIVGDWQPPGDDPRRPAELQLAVAPVAALLDDAAVPLDVTLVLGDARLTAVGTVADPFDDPAPLFDLVLEAPSLADFDAIAEEPLPPLGPARATASLSLEGETIRLDNLVAKVDMANIAGAIELYPLASPFGLSGTLGADRIDLSGIPAAYWDVYGVEMAEDPRLFPATPFNLAKLSKADVDLDIRIGEVVLPQGYDVDRIALVLTVAGGHLDGAAEYDTRYGGRAAAFLVIDARGEVPEIEVQMEFADEEFGDMLADWGLIGQATGNASLSYEFSARGDSLREIASTLNGDFELKAGDGEFNDEFMGAFAYGLSDAFRPLLGGEREVRLNCLVVRLDFEDGVGTLEPLLLHTSTFYAVGQGTIDLRDETVEARIDTGTDKVSLTRFALPLRVSGSLKEPEVTTIKTSGRSLMIVGSVVGTVLMPLPAIAAMVAGEVVDGGGDPCGEAIDAIVRQGQPVPEPAAISSPPPLSD